MKTISAKTPVELAAKIYKRHGWVRQRGESRWKRIKELYTLSIDKEKQCFRADPIQT